MELVLNLLPEEELQVRKEADSSGMEINEYALLRLLGRTSSADGKPEHTLRSADYDVQKKQADFDMQNQEKKPDDSDPSIALLLSWIAQAPSDPEAIREAEEDLLEFKKNMNLPRRETGARLHYPEAE